MKKIIGIAVLIVVFVLGIALGIYFGRTQPAAPQTPKSAVAKTEPAKPDAGVAPKRPKLVRYKVMLKDLKRFKVKKN